MFYIHPGKESLFRFNYLDVKISLRGKVVQNLSIQIHMKLSFQQDWLICNSALVYFSHFEVVTTQRFHICGKNSSKIPCLQNVIIICESTFLTCQQVGISRKSHNIWSKDATPFPHTALQLPQPQNSRSKYGTNSCTYRDLNWRKEKRIHQIKWSPILHLFFLMLLNQIGLHVSLQAAIYKFTFLNLLFETQGNKTLMKLFKVDVKTGVL